VRIDLPLRRVTAYEDRAAFERSGAVTLPGGPLELEIEGVSPLISDAHLSGALLDAPAGAAVDDVRVERRWVAVGGESAERMLALERTLEAAADARFVTEQGLTRSAERRAAAERELARFIEAGARAAWSGLDVPAFSAGERNLALALQTSDAAVDAARQALQAATEHEQRLQGLLAQGRATRQVLETTLRVRISGPAGPAQLRIRGLYPCALWRPTHEAHLRRAADGQEHVEWTTFGTLWQRTGEDWRGVEVTLSTARPGAGADLPALTEDRLRIRDRVPKPKVTVVAHRETAAARPDLEAAAPGVYDGGEARVWQASEPVTLPSDGRPSTVAIGRTVLPAKTNLCAVPEVSGLVFLEALLRNGDRPLLAGPVTLLRDGAHVGVGDLDYIGPGEPFTLSFGSDDRFDLAYERRVVTEERLLGRDRPVYVHEVELLSRAADRTRVEVVLRLPVSEMAAVKVVAVEKLCTEGALRPDADGRVRTPLDLIPGRRRTLRLAFGIDSGADVHIPPPW
jgi:uncharacterized protein (TIGR02231 family)